ncbi:cytochrome P450 monooxygenase azaI [Colletotrichum spaethianum]|uniref:Cytochrome P450 monooxygenase azaI n=1 Tax=Colletotrichum spaethianum TaxID=700344 RepID=A0AA37ULN1_9PEZI|nr:cytochrome P450 monooxygenase azaI [Colletotrichum spaethianum]GKT52156.1 cytochrome P450 monooxygenase azaI [Colletotrichum spaethianum]
MDTIGENAFHLGGALICVALAAEATQFIYTGLSNPLSNIPGPWYTRFTAIPSTYKFMTGHHPDWIHSLHARYGSIVRYSPSEVDVSDPAACQRIHSAKAGYLKTPFYTLLVTDASNVFNEIRPDIHRRFKRLLSHPMSETGLKTFYPRIDNKVRLAIDRMCDENTACGAADVAKWFMFLSFDVIGDIAFSESFGNLENGKFRVFDYAQKALDRHAKRVEELGSDPKPTVFSKIYDANEKEMLSRKEMRDNALAFIVGGSDTTANSMIYLVWAVCKNPRIKARLMKELSSLPEDYTYDHLKELTYLNCIVNESLRLYSALPGGLPRLVPPEGAELAGYFVPGRSVVATQAYSLHRNPDAFPDPYRFNPERWENTTQLMKDCSMPFGGGARSKAPILPFILVL